MLSSHHVKLTVLVCSALFLGDPAIAAANRCDEALVSNQLRPVVNSPLKRMLAASPVFAVFLETIDGANRRYLFVNGPSMTAYSKSAPPPNPPPITLETRKESVPMRFLAMRQIGVSERALYFTSDVQPGDGNQRLLLVIRQNSSDRPNTWDIARMTIDVLDR